MSETTTMTQAAIKLHGRSAMERAGLLNLKVSELDQKLALLNDETSADSVGYLVADGESETNDVNAAVEVSRDAVKTTRKKLLKYEAAVRGLTVAERAKDADRKFVTENRDAILTILRKNPKAEDRQKAVKLLRKQWDEASKAK